MLYKKYEIDEIIKKEINERFNYHTPTQDQIPRYQKIRELLKTLALVIFESCPPSREQSLALTHLEQVGFYANASIARREKQEVDV